MDCRKCADVIRTVDWNCVEFSARDTLAQVPKKWGVYAIVVRKPGLRINTIWRHLGPLVQRCEQVWPQGWSLLKPSLARRLQEIREHPQCPILYIGRSGTTPGRTLRQRFKELQGGHPVWPALWALLYHRWKLRFRWHECNDPVRLECKLMREFQSAHCGCPKMPALNKKRPRGCPTDDLP